MTRPSKVYAWAVVALTVAITVGSYVSEPDLPGLRTFAFWAALLAAVELLPVSLGFGTQVTMAFPIYFAVAILFEPLPAMVIAAVGAFDIREFTREIPLHRSLFNRAQTALTVGASSAVLWASSSGALDHSYGIVLIAAAALVRLTANLLLVATAVRLERGVSFDEAISGLFPRPVAGFVLSYALLTGLGVATAVAYDRIEYGALAVAAFFIPLLFARLSILGARAQQELSERVQKQQQALLDATEKVFQERERERNRIAEDIHDSSLQMLAAAAYGCGNAREFLAVGKSEAAAETIATAQEALDGAMARLRESLVDLRKSSVEEGGLIETIRHYADQVAILWGTEVRLEGEIVAEPPIPVALAAFQILQEGLVNALKHANSSAVVVRIRDDKGMVHIVVEDDGAGFDPNAEVGPDHVGMRLMRERASRVGGRILLDSQPGNGTRLEAILPGGITQ